MPEVGCVGREEFASAGSATLYGWLRWTLSFPRTGGAPRADGSCYQAPGRPSTAMDARVGAGHRVRRTRSMSGSSSGR